ncbi:MAG: hypothetical protein ACJ8AT_19815 [Hyalangium sp.]|uniref:hypothetical protein n=1 Tax=Hyalangium sp. TaxID=2028555 RepID=UPI003899C760
MPRGYSYDHFQVPKREPRERATPPDSLKAATSHKGDMAPLVESQEGLHYGRKNAETVTRLRARAEKRKAAQTEAPARATRAKAKKAAPAGRASAKAKTPARGGKLLSRVAAAAKTSVKRVAKKVTARKTPKKG